MRFLQTAALINCGLFLVSVFASCPDGYCRHSGGCYLVIGLNTTWINARDYCSVLGGSLLLIDSSTVQSTTEGVLRKSHGIHPGKFWLDISDLLNPGDWKNMETKRSISYSKWDIFGNSTPTTGGNCVSISRDSDYMWTTTDCEQKMNFVCYASGTKERMYRRYYRDYVYVDDEDDDIPC